jgi:hypothetical protein
MTKIIINKKNVVTEQNQKPKPQPSAQDSPLFQRKVVRRRKGLISSMLTIINSDIRKKVTRGKVMESKDKWEDWKEAFE